MGLGLILVLGLLTGFHCVGMCGGFVLSYTAGDARLGQSSHLSHLLYGMGKILSYTVIGALFGLLGAIVAFTPMLRGVAGVSAGIFLIIFGLNMLNIIPVLRKIGFKLPAFLSWVLSGQQTRSRKRPFMIGLLNGFMIACGPLQAMYVMAAGSGSAFEGAKMLFTFGVGTLPVLLSFGFLTSLISGAPMADHFQTITMDVVKSGFEPNHFVLRQEIPVKWVIDGKDVMECNRRIVVPKLGLEFDVKEGVQTIEFTPNETGLIPRSCWIGMLHGQFEVIAEPAITEKPPSVASMDKPPPSPSGSMTARPPASTEEPSVQAKNAGIPETYKVTAGDTLSKIAHKHYGDATKWCEIESANPGLNLKKLKSSQILYLPNLPANGSSKKRQ
ncbi:sulfite exporter TauE/SafE family protein [Methylocapsa sp. D3K7]|uniref:urease accessory protein UreH domain-containing protein n=1 Tax=Methylocapsa sp. D3K7 TaxID=3041435 RepID=UPI00244E67C9|nr:sulfite exporter TauE/SafE family protein [Methylocapsa sp. D3K7]WGJ15836.1 sulfite exporter TauE/SafE family protein [Methylocapsa sp. D3K7]